MLTKIRSLWTKWSQRVFRYTMSATAGGLGIYMLAMVYGASPLTAGAVIFAFTFALWDAYISEWAQGMAWISVYKAAKAAGVDHAYIQTHPKKRSD